MKRIFVQYKTKPEAAAENTRLLENVFKELKAKAPKGVGYMTLRLPDGTFLHFNALEDGAPPVTSLKAFGDYLDGIKERLVAPPQQSEPVVIGQYGFFAE
ncbi:MAG TPA: hypothetical protein VN766_17860 [Stellaceae bacterium]|nr:hypothetical protein [Stellaceae bacterium]